MVLRNLFEFYDDFSLIQQFLSRYDPKIGTRPRDSYMADLLLSCHRYCLLCCWECFLFTDIKLSELIGL